MKKLWFVFFKRILTGILLIVWCKVSEWLEAGTLLRTAGYVLIPVWIYAEHSQVGEREKTGTVCAWFLLAAGLWSELSELQVGLLAGSFVLSGAFCALAEGAFPRAEEENRMPGISGRKRRKYWMFSSYTMLVLSAGFMCVWELKEATAAVLCAWLLFFLYYWESKRRMGGITRQSLLWFSRSCELLMAASVYLMGKL